jgi:small-conductance mechanosensitive channel
MGEPAKKIEEYPTAHHAKADELLAQAAEVAATLKRLLDNCHAELKQVTQEWGELILPQKRLLDGIEKQIKAYAKKHRVDLFEGRDRIDLSHGALLRKEEERVKQIRGMLERLEEIGATDAIKTVKSADWEVIEGWTDERLIEVGTERVKKETFAYELFEE